MQERSIHFNSSETKQFLHDKDIALSSLEDNLDVISNDNPSEDNRKRFSFNDDTFSDDEIYEYISKYQALMSN